MILFGIIANKMMKLYKNTIIKTRITILATIYKKINYILDLLVMN